jgi:hypothetical protein
MTQYKAKFEMLKAQIIIKKWPIPWKKIKAYRLNQLSLLKDELEKEIHNQR